MRNESALPSGTVRDRADGSSITPKVPTNKPMNNTQEKSARDSVDVHRLVSTYRPDYPKKRIGGGNPYYKCARCGVSEPEINGQLDGHRDSCSWANHQRNLSDNATGDGQPEQTKK